MYLLLPNCGNYEENCCKHSYAGFCVDISNTVDIECNLLGKLLTSLIPQLVKNPPVMQETLVQFLGQEDPLEKG